MHFALSENLIKEPCDTWILGVHEAGVLPTATVAADQILSGILSDYLSLKDFSSKLGETQVIYPPKGSTVARVILVGLGKQEGFDAFKYQKALKSAAKALQKQRSLKIACFFPELKVGQQSLYYKVRQAIETIEHSLYRFKEFKSKISDEAQEHSLEKSEMFFPIQALDLSIAQTALEHGKAIAQASHKVRDLGNMPGNQCTPRYLAQAAQTWIQGLPNTHCKILSESQIEELGMGAFAAVAKGSEESAQLVVLEYKGAPGQPIALIGKGITFDTGGISLKNSQIIMGMKYDMCGAASVLAAFHLAASLKLPIHLVALMACAENMPSGHATRPDDIVKTMSGKTVEIANTDAEGRLVLCDTLTYAQKTFEPAILIDVATLTGACVAALGRHPSGLLGNQQPLCQELIDAGQASLDRVWQMPLWEDYQSQLDSPFADMINIGGPEAGMITAACFLSRFIENNTPWAHLDIAGTAFTTGKDAHASGRPIALLAEFLLRRAAVVPA